MTKKSKKFIKNGRFYFEAGHYSVAISATEAAKLAQVTPQTAERWLYGYHSPSEAVIELIRLKATGQIIPPRWGARFADNRLITQNNEVFTAGALENYGLFLSDILKTR